MTAQNTPPAWQRLGKFLERRRVELDIRYRNLTLFCEERHLDYRLAWDIEHAARINYRHITLVAIELAYGLEQGGIQQVLNSEVPGLRDLHRDFPRAAGAGDDERKRGNNGGG